MRRPGAFIAALVVVHAAGGFAQQPQTTFRGRADSVAIDVSVRRAGRPIPGLTVPFRARLDPKNIKETTHVRRTHSTFPTHRE